MCPQGNILVNVGLLNDALYAFRPRSFRISLETVEDVDRLRSVEALRTSVDHLDVHVSLRPKTSLGPLSLCFERLARGPLYTDISFLIMVLFFFVFCFILSIRCLSEASFFGEKAE